MALVGIVNKLEKEKIELVMRDTKKKMIIEKPKGKRDPIYDKLEKDEAVFVQENKLVTSFNSGQQDYYLSNVFNKEKIGLTYYRRRIYNDCVGQH
ncbi:hypothetical protein GF336_02390 [Candidatus Woesearchaeota archaeon]|nr:hypothetical protein [Candidatus Woesearchaeota archaeon]